VRLSVLFAALRTSVSILLRDRLVLLLAMAPVLIGIIVYYYAGTWFYRISNEWLSGVVESYITKDITLTIVRWLIKAILAVFVAIAVGQTFVLLVSIIASPFNDLLSSRVEQLMGKTPAMNMNDSMKSLVHNFFRSIRDDSSANSRCCLVRWFEGQ
jgi:CysZ protein